MCVMNSSLVLFNERGNELGECFEIQTQSCKCGKICPNILKLKLESWRDKNINNKLCPY